MRVIFNIFFFLLSFSALGQNLRISGVVLNKETQMPVSNASIFTKNSKIGTVSTSKGNFSLNIPDYHTNNHLYFSCIGYETDSVQISKALSPLSVQLKPIIYSLKEVYIMPDSTLLALLKKAYNKIPENYPDHPTRYEGFFQESSSKNDSLVELIEAVLSVYKESYLKKRKMPGQVEILRSRMKQFQNIRAGFVGGAFLSIDDDAVLQRASYISPSKMKYFKYDFSGIKNYQGRDCYEIEFHPLNKDSSNIQGNMLIDIETLAYVFFEINVEQKENAKIFIGIMKPIETKSKILYDSYNGKWYLKQVSTQKIHDNIRLDSPLYSSFDFITTQILTDSVNPIPVEKRLEYLDPIEARTEVYNPKGWTDSDIIANENPEQLGFQFSTDESSDIFNRPVSEKFSLTKTILHTLPKLIIGSGVSYNPTHKLIVFQDILGYRFNKKWSIQTNWVEDFYCKNTTLKEIGLGIEFKKNLNNAGRPLYLGSSLWITDSRFTDKFEFVKKQMITP